MPHLVPLVGAFHRPPATSILASLPLGYELAICPEPDNPFDPNAIAVFCSLEALTPEQKEKLEADLPRWGFDSITDVMFQKGVDLPGHKHQVIQLGYVARTHTTAVLFALGAQHIVYCRFGILADGKPAIQWHSIKPIESTTKAQEA